MPRSIMMLVTSFHPNPMGGSELQALRLARELQAKGMTVFIVALGRHGQKSEDEFESTKVFRIKTIFNPDYFGPKRRATTQAVRIEYADNDKANFIVQGKKTFLSLIFYAAFFGHVWWLMVRRKEPFDVIYVPIMEWTAFVGTLLGKLMSKKVVIKDSTINGITALLRYPFGKFMRRTICRHSYFVAMTRAIKANLIVAGVSESKIVSIPNGVVVPARAPRTEVDPNKFVFVGNLYQQPAKGIDILLKAWKKLSLHRPEARLFVIGDGNIPEYQTHVKDLGISNVVHFLGKQKEFAHHLSQSVAFILPSRREGMSNSLLEAMSLGVPCIATDISGSQDLIENGVNGMLVPVEDVDSLVAAVEFVYQNPDAVERMGQKGRETILNGYTFDMVAEKYYKLLSAI